MWAGASRLNIFFCNYNEKKRGKSDVSSSSLLTQIWRTTDKFKVTRIHVFVESHRHCVPGVCVCVRVTPFTLNDSLRAKCGAFLPFLSSVFKEPTLSFMTGSDCVYFLCEGQQGND